MTRRKRRARPLPRRPVAKPGESVWRCSSTAQNSRLSQRRVAVFIGVGKVVAAGRPCPAQSRKRPTVQPQGITDIIEAEGVGQLRKEHADHVTPGTEGSRP